MTSTLSGYSRCRATSLAGAVPAVFRPRSAARKPFFPCGVEASYRFNVPASLADDLAITGRRLRPSPLRVRLSSTPIPHRGGGRGVVSRRPSEPCEPIRPARSGPGWPPLRSRSAEFAGWAFYTFPASGRAFALPGVLSKPFDLPACLPLALPAGTPGFPGDEDKFTTPIPPGQMRSVHSFRVINRSFARGLRGRNLTSAARCLMAVGSRQ